MMVMIVGDQSRVAALCLHDVWLFGDGSINGGNMTRDGCGRAAVLVLLCC